MTCNAATLKQCSECKEWKDRETGFCRNRSNRDGRNKYCRTCNSKKAVDRRLKNRQRNSQGVCRLGEKRCAACKELKLKTDFGLKLSESDGLSALCSACIASRDRRYRAANRMRILDAYGNKCACCGETRHEFLAVDHVNNDGAKHRREFSSTAMVYPDIIRRNFPPDFQILCFNCNCAKGIYGKCPHQLEKENESVNVQGAKGAE